MYIEYTATHGRVAKKGNFCNPMSASTLTHSQAYIPKKALLLKPWRKGNLSLPKQEENRKHEDWDLLRIVGVTRSSFDPSARKVRCPQSVVYFRQLPLSSWMFVKGGDVVQIMANCLVEAL